MIRARGIQSFSSPSIKCPMTSYGLNVSGPSFASTQSLGRSLRSAFNVAGVRRKISFALCSSNSITHPDPKDNQSAFPFKHVHTSTQEESGDSHRVRRRGCALDVGDLFFLDLQEFVDFSNVTVGEFLDFLESVAFGVFGDYLILQHLLKTLIAVAARISHCRAVVFGDVMQLFGELSATFLGKRRDRNAHKFAIV